MILFEGIFFSTALAGLTNRPQLPDSFVPELNEVIDSRRHIFQNFEPSLGLTVFHGILSSVEMLYIMTS